MYVIFLVSAFQHLVHEKQRLKIGIIPSMYIRMKSRDELPTFVFCYLFFGKSALNFTHQNTKIPHHTSSIHGDPDGF